MTGVECRQVAILAAKELRERLRNRWVLTVAAVFAVFSLVICYFGGAEQGALGRIPSSSSSPAWSAWSSTSFR